MHPNTDKDNSITNPSGQHRVPKWDKDHDMVIVYWLVTYSHTHKKKEHCHPSFAKPYDFFTLEEERRNSRLDGITLKKKKKIIVLTMEIAQKEHSSRHNMNTYIDYDTNHYQNY